MGPHLVDGISIREFARRDGCSDRLVRDAITAGYLRKTADGKLDPAAVGTPWRKGNRGAEAGAESPRLRTPHHEDLRTSTELAQPTVEIALEHQPHGGALKRQRRAEVVAAGDDEDSDPETWTQAIADRRKATANARLRELEYDQKVGLVVPVDAVLELVAKEYASVRTRLLAIPAEQAPRIHRCRTPAEVQDALHELIVQALEGLTQDADGAAGGA